MDNNALVIPAGLAFAKAVSKHPKSISTPSKARIRARPAPISPPCVVYAALTGRSPVGNTYLANIDAQTAAFLQHVGGTP